jgi:hypothetical protein
MVRSADRNDYVDKVKKGEGHKECFGTNAKILDP